MPRKEVYAPHRSDDRMYQEYSLTPHHCKIRLIPLLHGLLSNTRWTCSPARLPTSGYVPPTRQPSRQRCCTYPQIYYEERRNRVPWYSSGNHEGSYRILGSPPIIVSSLLLRYLPLTHLNEDNLMFSYCYFLIVILFVFLILQRYGKYKQLSNR